MIRDKRNDAITVYRYRQHNSMAREGGGGGGGGGDGKKHSEIVHRVDRAWNAGHVSVFN